PATLGLKVRLDELQRTARSGNVLHVVGFNYATSCNKMQVTETTLYAHPYAHPSPTRATRCALRSFHAASEPRGRAAATATSPRHRRLLGRPCSQGDPTPPILNGDQRHKRLCVAAVSAWAPPRLLDHASSTPLRSAISPNARREPFRWPGGRRPCC